MCIKANRLFITKWKLGESLNKYCNVLLNIEKNYNISGIIVS